MKSDMEITPLSETNVWYHPYIYYNVDFWGGKEMHVFSYEWIGIVITGFATMFLIGEILVNMRGFFALLGIGFITVYFSVYVETNSLMMMLLIYFVGLILIVIDGKLLNDGTLAT